jgi:hypothetical protein
MAGDGMAEAPKGNAQVEEARIAGVKARRRRFHDALVSLEKALATAAGHPDVWRETVISALSNFDEVLAAHIKQTEAPQGFFNEILGVAPRLAPSVRRLREEHEQMTDSVSDLLAWCQKEDEDIEGLRERALDVLKVAVEHRQRGSDLLYEAYEVDISAGD